MRLYLFFDLQLSIGVIECPTGLLFLTSPSVALEIFNVGATHENVVVAFLTGSFLFASGAATLYGVYLSRLHSPGLSGFSVWLVLMLQRLLFGSVLLAISLTRFVSLQWVELSAGLLAIALFQAFELSRMYLTQGVPEV